MALVLSCRLDMRAGAVAGALVAGVHLQATWTSTVYVSTAGMLSPAGRCQVRASRQLQPQANASCCARLLLLLLLLWFT
jgi:hypothetical protein